MFEHSGGPNKIVQIAISSDPNDDHIAALTQSGRIFVKHGGRDWQEVEHPLKSEEKAKS